MRNYLQESLHWLHLAFFKPFTLKHKAKRLSKKEARSVYLKTFPVSLVIMLVLDSTVGMLCELTGISFNWLSVLRGTLFGGLFFGLCGGVLFGLFGKLFFGLVLGGVGGLFGGLGIGLFGELFAGFVSGLISGLYLGLGTLGGGNVRRMFVSLFVLLSGLACAGALILHLLMLGGGIELDKQLQNKAVNFSISYTLTFMLVYLRPFYLLPHLVQFWRANANPDPFKLFRHSPIYWDEVTPLQLPYLTEWLVRLVRYNHERGLAEIGFVAAKRPYQRPAAQKALLAVIILDLTQINSVEEMAEAAAKSKSFRPQPGLTLRGWDEAHRLINSVAALAQDFQVRPTPVGKVKVMEELRGEVQSFWDSMSFFHTPFLGPPLLLFFPKGNRFSSVGPPISTLLIALAKRWLEVVIQAEAECRRQLTSTLISNPFIAGNPLQPRDLELFKGRKDIIIAIEETIMNLNQRPALLLYGRRRIGKSSILLNLQRLLSSEYIPIYLDCQNAKWRDSNALFCYQLVNAIYGELFQRELHDGLNKPVMEEFEQRTFTRLDDYIGCVEDLSRRIGKQIILTFDEYEHMEEGIRDARITHEIFNQLRNLVQHHDRLIMLFSGSHHFEEAHFVNWADYLINVKTLELTNLTPNEARELVEHPVPDFKLRYELGVVERILHLTNCQPYLLQAVASDLVNHLNRQKRQRATLTDLEVAVERVLVTAQAYFHCLWSEDCNDAEQVLLRTLATDDAVGAQVEQHQTAWQSLCRKEIVEMEDDQYRFAVELFHYWILKNHFPREPIIKHYPKVFSSIPSQNSEG